VKIITQDGKVTLRGPVASPEEKKRIEEMASQVAGAGNVQTELEVEPSP
jgi:osmotically-inducible protein OsmY